jgi:hypothetical protein
MIGHWLTRTCTLKRPEAGPYVEASQEYGTSAILEDVQRMYAETVWSEAATGVPCHLSHSGGDSALIFLPFGTEVERNWVVICDGRLYHVTGVDHDPGYKSHHVEVAGMEVWPS